MSTIFLWNCSLSLSFLSLFVSLSRGYTFFLSFFLLFLFPLIFLSFLPFFSLFLFSYSFSVLLYKFSFFFLFSYLFLISFLFPSFLDFSFFFPVLLFFLCFLSFFCLLFSNRKRDWCHQSSQTLRNRSTHPYVNNPIIYDGHCAN